MSEVDTKLQVKTEDNDSRRQNIRQGRRPLQNLRRGFDQFLEDFQLDFLRSSWPRSVFDVDAFRQRFANQGVTLAVDVVETDAAYEITADLPGLDKDSIEVQVAGGNLTIKGEKEESKEEKQKAYYLRERMFGRFQRSFRIPEAVDADKIEATFKNGELTVLLPKKPQAQMPTKQIDVKGA